MKSLKKALSMLICAFTLFTVFSENVTALGDVSGQSAVVSENIYVNGKDTGALYTQITLPSGSKYNPYKSDSVINVIEVEPSSGLSFAAINCGKYTYNTSTLGACAEKYNSSHNGTVIAAVNADPWFVYHSDYDGDGKRATGAGVKHQSITRNLLIIDGEIYQTSQTALENMLNNNATEYNTPAVPSCTFAQNSDGSFMIGKFELDITIKNETKVCEDIYADGINRLPAPGAIMIYNQRVGDESMAYTDAYEIYLNVDNSAFKLGGSVTGKVVGIYESGDADRAEIDENTVIISARGRASVPESCTKVTDKILTVSGKFSVGDTVSISTALSEAGDTYEPSQTEKWNTVTNAVGGFYNQITRGEVNPDLNADGSEKNNADPVSLIALKEDGSAMMITITSKSDVRAGTRQKYIGDICRELGAYTALMFDGGGSTAIITYEDGAYLRRGGYADGSPRRVVNALALVYGGESIDVRNAELEARRDIDGIANDSPLPPTPDLVGEATTEYRYTSNIDFINDKGPSGSESPYGGIVSFKNNTSGAYSKAVVSEGVSAENGMVSVRGWAVVNGGQGDYFWSIDGYNWYKCTDTKYNLSMGNWEAIKEAAISCSALTSVFEERAKFYSATAQLTPWAGKTVDVYFGVGISDNSRVAYMVKIENVSVSEASVHEHTPGKEADCDTPQICTECKEELSPALGHDEIKHPAKPATCTQDGCEAYVTCSRCDYSTYSKTDKLSHTYDDENDSVCNLCGRRRKLISDNKNGNMLGGIICVGAAGLIVMLVFVLLRKRRG